jgi:hypothetical protein
VIGVFDPVWIADRPAANGLPAEYMLVRKGATNQLLVSSDGVTWTLLTGLATTELPHQGSSFLQALQFQGKLINHKDTNNQLSADYCTTDGLNWSLVGTQNYNVYSYCVSPTHGLITHNGSQTINKAATLAATPVSYTVPNGRSFPIAKSGIVCDGDKVYYLARSYDSSCYLHELDVVTGTTALGTIPYDSGPYNPMYLVSLNGNIYCLTRPVGSGYDFNIAKRVPGSSYFSSTYIGNGPNATDTPHAAYLGGVYIIAFNNSTSYVTSTDSNNFTARTLPVVALGLCAFKGYFYLFGVFTLYRSADGINWTNVTPSGYGSSWVLVTTHNATSG